MPNEMEGVEGEEDVSKEAQKVEGVEGKEGVSEEVVEPKKREEAIVSEEAVEPKKEEAAVHKLAAEIALSQRLATSSLEKTVSLSSSPAPIFLRLNDPPLLLTTGGRNGAIERTDISTESPIATITLTPGGLLVVDPYNIKSKTPMSHPIILGPGEKVILGKKSMEHMSDFSFWSDISGEHVNVQFESIDENGRASILFTDMESKNGTLVHNVRTVEADVETPQKEQRETPQEVQIEKIVVIPDSPASFSLRKDDAPLRVTTGKNAKSNNIPIATIHFDGETLAIDTVEILDPNSRDIPRKINLRTRDRVILGRNWQNNDSRYIFNFPTDISKNHLTIKFERINEVGEAILTIQDHASLNGTMVHKQTKVK